MKHSGNTPTDAASILQHMGHSLSWLPAEEHALMISTHGPESPLSRWLLRQTGHVKDALQLCLSGSPDEIVERVREAAKNGIRLDRAAFGFEMHHLTLPQALEVLLWTRDMLREHGAVLFADYALAGKSESEIEVATCTTLEERQVQGPKYKGDRVRWIADHRVYTGHVMRQIVQQAGFPVVVDYALPASRHVVAATGSLAVPAPEWPHAY